MEPNEEIKTLLQELVNCFSKHTNLQGKDYFTEREAAHYMCISYAHFRKIAKAIDLQPVIVFGKRVYRRSDLARIIEHVDDYKVVNI
jgi:hypothetical protein